MNQSHRAPTEIVTAGILVIGDEILSGRTKDRNSGYIAEYLTQIGIETREVRTVPDVVSSIVEALDALRGRYTYVFTAGGIGPTHDDVTADAVAAAFGVALDVDQRAIDEMLKRYDRSELNEARLRMARVPHGAELIVNAVSYAPGFHIGNVFVMAGVPNVMQSMMDALAPKLRTGARVIAETIPTGLPEGVVAGPLAEIAEANPGAMIGSYPRFENGVYATSVVVRSRDPDLLSKVKTLVEDMVISLTDTR